MSNHDDRPMLDAAILRELTEVFTSGVLDALAGYDVKEADRLTIKYAGDIETIAADAIRERKEQFVADYRADPKGTRKLMYETGQSVYNEVERQHIQRN